MITAGPSSAPGPMTVAHGLPQAPVGWIFLMTSAGFVYQGAAPDATDLHLVASGVGVSLIIEAW